MKLILILDLLRNSIYSLKLPFLASLLFLFYGPLFLHAGQTLDEMFQSLEKAVLLDQKLCERFPVTYNHIFSSGYFSTHSARMGEAGEVGVGAAHAPPYLNLNARIQPYSHLELTINYRIFRGFEDPNLGPHGFGNYADRGANFKLAFFTPEQSCYRFPGLAFGIDDFMGSKKFTTYYLVSSYVFKNKGVEASVGWGTGRYTHGTSKGFFAGCNWFPLYHGKNPWWQGIGLVAELDPVNYATDPYPKKIQTHSPINFGTKYKYHDLLELSFCWLRGHSFAASGSLNYNWGKTEGFLPKIKDPLPYTSPIDHEPIGCTRHCQIMIQDLNYSLESQGFQLTNAWLTRGEDSMYRLTLQLFNFRYRQEHLLRERLQKLLAALIPNNVSEVIIVLESYGLPCQQYTYHASFLKSIASNQMTPYELDILSPRTEALPPKSANKLIFQRRSDLWHFRASPRFETFLGNSKGKFKYDLGIKASIEGFLPYNWYYEAQASYTFLSSLNGVSDFDFFNPSQLPNVATDYVRYRQEGTFSWDMLYAQKTWNCSRGFFTRVAGGYFQVNYAGMAGEVLWYPSQSYFAVGLEGAVVKKRNYTGLGFQSTIRHFKGKAAVFSHYTTLQQYFLTFYFDFPAFCTFSKIGLGQFLGRDKGARIEVTRYFDNGLRLTAWVTLTNAHDLIHCNNYYDRGIAVEVPFDFFYKCSSRRVWNYATAAWLRDAGYAIFTGKSLFEIINRERRW